jgi:hypothetical protein
MTPEQSAGRLELIDRRSDVYGLGGGNPGPEEIQSILPTRQRHST